MSGEAAGAGTGGAGRTHERPSVQARLLATVAGGGLALYGARRRGVVGSVVAHEGRVLLCRRAIEPRRDYWTLPAGYMELGETLQAGAIREAQEEAEADISLDGVLAMYSISRIGQSRVRVCHAGSRVMSVVEWTSPRYSNVSGTMKPARVHW